MAHIQLIGILEPKSEDGKILRFPYAFPIIIRQLQKTDHTFDLVDTHLHKKTKNELLDFIRRCQAKVYGISSYSEGYNFVRILAKTIRETHPDAVIIVGGLLAKSDDVLMEKTEVDIAVTSADGELILPEILDALDLKNGDFQNVKGITYKDRTQNRIVKTEPRSVMTKELYQKMEMPAYEYFDDQIRELVHNINSREDMPVQGFPLLTTRGCPFNCTFCGQIYGRKFLRKNWGLFFDELQFLIHRYGVKGFFSYDTNMFLSEKDVDDYCNMYAQRGCNFTMVIEMRATFGNYEMFKKLREHGVLVITYGFESGSQIMLDRMKKGVKLERMKQIISDALRADVIVYGNFIFATPGENKKTAGETRDFMYELQRQFLEQKRSFQKRGLLSTSGYNWSILVAAPTSEIYENAVKDGAIKDIESYLISLDKEDYSYDYIRFHSRYLGGDVNLSEFRSKRAMENYVRYSLSLVKQRVLISEKDNLLGNSIEVLKRSFELLYLYAKYCFVNICDILTARS